MASSASAERRWRRRGLVLAAALLCAAALRGGARLAAEILAGGSLSMPFPFFSGGGGDMITDGTLAIQGSIGQGASTYMTGGGFSLQSCVSGCVSLPASLAASDLSSAHAFPVPFKPSLGHLGITFRGLTTQATIHIYTLSGELVTTLSKDDPSTGDLVWSPVVNSAGQTVASGVYLYVIDGNPGRARGKLMVIR
ncbi:MAG TPA: T9SS type A sorting domain-containing protein [Elusimicrobiota bacterium]|nr:T9SS type A sorting domain-containing protein [Elusimicrobiota bacterium]